MFSEPTVFILGAGASWHYGYPTGEELVEEVKVMAGLFEKVVQSRGKCGYYGVNVNNVIDFKKRLIDADPLVIDNFLARNPDHEKIGRICIAMALIRRLYLSKKIDENIKFNWLKFILNELMLLEGTKQLIDNQINFITFNYDTSLDEGLNKGLEAVFTSDEVEAFMENDRIIHVYGKLKEPNLGADQKSRLALPKEDFDRDLLSGRDYSFLLEEGKDTSENIITMGSEKSSYEYEINKAKKLIDDAKNVFILGYGFDKQNNERLGLYKSLNLKQNSKNVFFTNYGNSGRINKIAHKLFFGQDDPEMITPPRGVKRMSDDLFKDQLVNLRSVVAGETNVISTLEKSINSVYDALAKDFDLTSA